MINKSKTHRLMIQVTIKQYEWLLKKANNLDISISQLVRWLLNKKIKDINDIKKLETNPKQCMETLSDEEWEKTLDELTKIKTPANIIADESPANIIADDLPF